MSPVDPPCPRRPVSPPTSSELIGLAYEAAADPSLWPSWFHALAQSVDHRLSTVVIRGFGLTRYVDLETPGTGFSALNPAGVFLKKTLSKDSFAIAFVGNEIVDEWSQLGSDGPGAIGIELFGEAGGTLETEDRVLLGAVLPHLHRALGLFFKLDEVQRERDTLGACLDEFSTGMLLVDENAALLHTNRAALEDLDGRHGLVYDNGRLHDASADEDACFRRMVKQAANGRDRGLRCKRLHSGATLWVRGVGARRALVVIGYDKPARPLSPELLANAFDLTPAEGRVGSLFAAGRSVDEIAACLEISVHTVRLHLKKIQHKTGTRRQAALVRRMLETVPQIHSC